jgi:hypothetical protein
MDHIVNINDGAEDVAPVVLRLLPGEETIFEIRVVNHGEPSNVSIQPSPTVGGALRLRRPDHYVVMEETIPILATMPRDLERLDGEVLVTWDGRVCRVPISLISEEPGRGARDAEGDLKDVPGPESDEGSEEVSSFTSPDSSYSAARRRAYPYPEASYGGAEPPPAVAEEEAQEEPSFDLEEGRTLRIVPLSMLASLIAVLVLTFYTASIPEFLGALASSILIVTLIIYGAAILLKA